MRHHAAGFALGILLWLAAGPRPVVAQEGPALIDLEEGLRRLSSGAELLLVHVDRRQADAPAEGRVPAQLSAVTASSGMTECRGASLDLVARVPGAQVPSPPSLVFLVPGPRFVGALAQPTPRRARRAAERHLHFARFLREHGFPAARAGRAVGDHLIAADVYARWNWPVEGKQVLEPLVQGSLAATPAERVQAFAQMGAIQRREGDGAGAAGTLARAVQAAGESGLDPAAYPALLILEEFAALGDAEAWRRIVTALGPVLGSAPSPVRPEHQEGALLLAEALLAQEPAQEKEAGALLDRILAMPVDPAVVRRALRMRAALPWE